MLSMGWGVRRDWRWRSKRGVAAARDAGWKEEVVLWLVRGENVGEVDRQL